METVRIGFWMRLAAAVIDSVIVAVLVWVPTVVLSKIHPSLGIAVGGALALAYGSLEVFRAHAIGKMVFKYTITNQGGSPATRGQLVKRYAYKQLPQALMILSAMPFLGFVAFLGGAASLAILVGALMTLKPERLAFHDKLFGTAVYGPEKVTFTLPSVSDVLPAVPTPPAPQTAKAA